MRAAYVMLVSVALYSTIWHDAHVSAFFLVYKLTPSSTLIGQECVICFEEFESGTHLYYTVVIQGAILFMVLFQHR